MPISSIPLLNHVLAFFLFTSSFSAKAELPTSHVNFQQVPEEIERVMVGVEAYLSIRRRVSDAGVSVFEDIEESNNVVNEKVYIRFMLY